MKKSQSILLLMFLPFVLSAQIDTLRINRSFAGKCWQDTKTAFTAPAHWDSRDWTTFGVVTASTASLFLVDEPMRDVFQDWHDEWGSSGDKFTANFLEPWGGEYSLALIGGFMGYGLLAKDQKSQSTALLATESFILASLIVRVPKTLIGRARPDAEPDISAFKFEGPINGTSLPSGHTTAVFAVASVIANQYRDHLIVPIISYSIATATGLSRIYDNKHWFSDVVAGAAIGITVGNLVSGRKNKDKKLAVIPFSTGRLQGVKLAYNL